MKVKFHPAARADLREAKAFYQHRSPLAAAAFANEIELAISRIREAPEGYPNAEHGTREFVLPWPFPYTVVYRVNAEFVVIVAISHHSREPGHWHHRQ